MSNFDGKVVLVTGAGGGIGREISKHFCQRGARLCLSDVNESSLLGTVEVCKNIGSTEIFTVVADLTNMAELNGLVKKVVDKFGRVDVLVNNAGAAALKSIENFTETDYDRIMTLNAKAPFFLTKALLPELVKTKGNIVNIGSVGATSAFQELTVYCMSKAAIAHLTTCLARDYAAKGVRVNSICPGITNTAAIGTEENPSYLKRYGDDFQPYGGIIEPEEIARWVVHVASEEAGPLTGQNIKVDGGFSVAWVPVGYRLIKE